jgi:hypothetical protein
MANDFTKQQLNTILSALDGKPRNPANRAAALKAIEKSAKALDLSLDDVLQAADGLIDGRMTAAEFLAELKDQPEAPAKPRTRSPRRNRGATVTVRANRRFRRRAPACRWRVRPARH